MAIRKLVNSNYLDNDWQDEIESKNIVKKGFNNLSFSGLGDHLGDSRIVTILAGSSIEVDGSVWVFDTDTSETIIYEASLSLYENNGNLYTQAADAQFEYNRTKKGIYTTSGKRVVALQTRAYSGSIQPAIVQALDADDNGIITVRSPIGYWNMDTMQSKVVRFPFNGYQNHTLLSIQAFITNDTGTITMPLNGFTSSGTIAGGVNRFEEIAESLRLERSAAGMFDNANYSSLANSRGYVVFKYAI